MDNNSLESIACLHAAKFRIFNKLSKVYFSWESESRVNLDFVIFLWVIDDALKVKDDNFGQLMKEGAFVHFLYLSFALLAGVSFDIFFVSKFFERTCQ